MRKRLSQVLASVGACLFLAACGSGPEMPEMCSTGKTLAPKKATSRPYQIKGVWYYPQPHFEYEEMGMASYYGGGDVFHGRPTATGERFDMNEVSAAHKTLPLPCVARVTNLENGREIELKVNDRGPYVEGRIIDLSRRAAQLLGFENKGTAKVHVRTLVPESLALHGLDPSTAMVSQEVPQIREDLPPVLVATLPKIPDTFFEHEELFEENEPSAVLTAVVSPPGIEKQERPKSTGIFVDVGSYASHREAQTLAHSLTSETNSPATPIQNTGPHPYAVRVGPFASMLLANQVLDQLVNAGHVMTRIIIHR